MARETAPRRVLLKGVKYPYRHIKRPRWPKWKRARSAFVLKKEAICSKTWNCSSRDDSHPVDCLSAADRRAVGIDRRLGALAQGLGEFALVPADAGIAAIQAASLPRRLRRLLSAHRIAACLVRGAAARGVRGRVCPDRAAGPARSIALAALVLPIRTHAARHSAGWQQTGDRRAQHVSHDCRRNLLWSGLAKLNPNFIDNFFPALVIPVVGAKPGPAQWVIHDLGFVAPLFECAPGVGLLMRRFRNAAVCSAIAMHVFILIALGPWAAISTP